FVTMICALGCGWLFVESDVGHIVVMMATTVGMCFTWPTLEALVSEGETYAGLQRSVGIYNVVWAATGALAYFSGGAMLDKLGLNSMFYVPIAIQLAQLALTLWLERETKRTPRPPPVASDAASRPRPAA